MRGAKADISDQIDSKFSAWDGHIMGSNFTLDPYRLIIQKRRTSDFSDEEEDSEIEVYFEESNEITNITLIHRHLSHTGSKYKSGWEDHYFTPMKKYFSTQ